MNTVDSMTGSLKAHQQLTISRRATIQRFLASDTALIAGIALISVMVHMLFAANYGYFRDELYYIAAGQHLAPGYVDFPPMIALLAALLRPFGDNLVIIHIVPALANGCLVFVAGLLAREFGGGRIAQGMAALTTAVCLVFMATGSIFSMDILDALWWSLAAYVLVLLIKRQTPRLWLLFGLVAGIGLTTKLTMLFWGLALVVGLLLTAQRRLLFNRWVLAGGVIAFALLLPYILWNAANGAPTWAFWHHYGGITGDGPVAYLANQIFLINPFTVPVAIAGLFFFFRARDGKPYRAFGWAYVFLYVLFTLIHTKSYFLGPAYPPLFAGGAVLIERAALRRVWVAPTVAAVLALSGILLAPLAMPILPPASFMQHYGFLAGQGNASAGQQNSTLPQYLGDRFGWPQLAATVAGVYNSLPASERAQACIVTSNYGEAGALQMYSAQYHLPPVVSGHNNYYFWGTGTCSGKVMITVNISQPDLEKSYSNVRLAATFTCAYCVSYENGAPIYIIQQPKYPLQQIWRSTQFYG